MQMVYERCAGLDVHKKTVVACLLVPDVNGQTRKERQTFSTMTLDRLAPARLAPGSRLYPCGHGIDRSLLEAHL
jgi:hypothetical protein